MRVLELFCGTKSLGKAFEALGADVVSLDLNPKVNPTICTNILTWEYEEYPRGHFDVIWASPVCQHYSRARTRGGPRDLESADALVLRTLQIIKYFAPPLWVLENPQTGMLKERPFMEGLPFKDVCYCRYGYKYRKMTRIWGNIPFEPRALCTRQNPCEHVDNGRHTESAQRGPTRLRNGTLHGSRFKQDELYSIPPELCESIAAASRDWFIQTAPQCIITRLRQEERGSTRQPHNAL